jgi:HPt (histidine-containing phosphotransfer) domain-containing protein
MERQVCHREPAVFDREDLLARCLGKLEFAERVLAKFTSRFDLDLDQLEQALRSEDPETIAHVAHRLKGASANVGAGRLREKAAEIEESARRGCLVEIPKRMEELRCEWHRFAESARSLECASW